MYRGFQLSLEAAKFAPYEDDGEQMYELFRDQLKEVLAKYAVSETVLNGSKMQADWFPQVKVDIFISHAHADKKLAYGLAGWLYDKFELISFIDSCIWGHADALLHKIDNAHNRNPDGNYNYQRRNRSTAHVHMMLNNALSHMIDHSECLFFLDTPRSTVQEIVEKKTESPWIYSELSLSRLIRKKEPERIGSRELVKLFSGKAMNEQQKEEARIRYRLELDHLQALTGAEMFGWARAWETRKELLHVNEGHPLDTLYSRKPLRKIE